MECLTVEVFPHGLLLQLTQFSNQNSVFRHILNTLAKQFSRSLEYHLQTSDLISFETNLIKDRK